LIHCDSVLGISAPGTIEELSERLLQFDKGAGST
jgi:hypothetical protein